MSSKKIDRKSKKFRKLLVNKNRELLNKKDVKESKEEKEVKYELGFSKDDIEYSIDLYKDLIDYLRKSKPDDYDKELDYLLHLYCYGGEAGIEEMINNGDVITELEAERIIDSCA